MARDILLFVNAIRPATFDALKDLEKRVGHGLTPVVIYDKKIKQAIDINTGQMNLPSEVTTIAVDFDSSHSIRNALKTYDGRIFAVTAQYESCIFELRKLLPHIPYQPGPTESSLVWSTEKALMRRLLEAYDPQLTPQYREIMNYSEPAIKKIENELAFPLMVKPSGLEGSFLVSLVSGPEQLRAVLKRTFDKMQSGYDREVKRQKPFVVIEEFMEGEMYSIDSYVAADGSCYHTPPVKVITGRNVGYEDFFGYMRLAPSGLSPAEVAKANQAADKACHALGLRSSSAHVELMRTAGGWKIIELGPRIGGYRHEIYRQAYGINHIANDILNRRGDIPEIPAKLINHTAVFIIYARQEGILESISGIPKVQKLASFVSLKQVLKKGDRLYFAKNNGVWVLEVMLAHPSDKQLAADIKTLEKELVIKVRPFNT